MVELKWQVDLIEKVEGGWCGVDLIYYGGPQAPAVPDPLLLSLLFFMNSQLK